MFSCFCNMEFPAISFRDLWQFEHRTSLFSCLWMSMLTLNSSSNTQKHVYLRCFHAASARENISGVWGIEPLGTNFTEIFIKLQNFSFTKMHLKMAAILSKERWVNLMWPSDAICHHGWHRTWSTFTWSSQATDWTKAQLLSIPSSHLQLHLKTSYQVMLMIIRGGMSLKIIIWNFINTFRCQCILEVDIPSGPFIY